MSRTWAEDLATEWGMAVTDPWMAMAWRMSSAASTPGKLTALTAETPEYTVAQNITGGNENCAARDWFQGSVRLLHDSKSDTILYAWTGLDTQNRIIGSLTRSES